MAGSSAAAAALIWPAESGGIVAQSENRRGGRVARFVEVNEYCEILQKLDFRIFLVLCVLEPILNKSLGPTQKDLPNQSFDKSPNSLKYRKIHRTNI